MQTSPVGTNLIHDADIYLSVLVLGEIRKGVERARPSYLARARALEKWLATMIDSSPSESCPIDQAIADEWGRMGARRPLSTVDALLAATAKVHGMTLATRNVARRGRPGCRRREPV